MEGIIPLENLGTYPYYVVIQLTGLLVAVLAIYLTSRYFDGGVCYSKATLNDKTVIITGANTGIGLETAVDLARRGARVILACRSADKGKAAVEVVKKRSKNQNVLFAQVDLASLQSVRDFASRILQEEPRIDILINNAGVAYPPYTKTQDNFELAFGINHLAHFLLTNLLLDRLKEAPAARIINVSSVGYKFGTINFDDLQGEKSYSKVKAYSQSKLANILFTRTLAERLKGTRASAYSLHPGAVRTDLGRHVVSHPLLVKLFSSLFYIVMKTPQQGAQTTIYCAVSEEVEGKSGEYFADCKLNKPTNPEVYDKEVADRLWRVSAQLVGL